MKKLILFLLASTSVLLGMRKTEMPIIPLSQNTRFQDTDENLTGILRSGSYNDLKIMLDNRIIKPTRIFLNRLFNEKSLLQATIELQLVSPTGKEGRYEIAQMLLDKGADKRDLDAYLIPAIKIADARLVTLLVDNGAQDTDGKAAIEVANQLQKSHWSNGQRQALTAIQKKLPGRQSLLMPLVRRPGKGPIAP